MERNRNNLGNLFVAILIMAFSIFAALGDAHAEYRNITGEGDTADYIDGVSSYFIIPFALIQIDGDKSDWESLEPVLADGLGDINRDADIEGADIDEVYIAHDDVFLYVLITLDGPPVWRQHVQYGFEANNNPHPGGDDTGQRLTYAHFMDNHWSAGVHERSSSKENRYYPASYVGIGPDFIEWKALLTDMGTLTGKYAWSYIHAYPWGSSEAESYPVSDSTDAVVRLIFQQ